MGVQVENLIAQAHRLAAAVSGHVDDWRGSAKWGNLQIVKHVSLVVCKLKLQARCVWHQRGVVDSVRKRRC